MSCRSDRPSAKNSDGRKGMYFGWLCISCRQPVSARKMNSDAEAQRRGEESAFRKPFLCVSASLRPIANLSVRNFRPLPRLQRLQETARVVVMEHWVSRLDTQEKPVARRQREP